MSYIAEAFEQQVNALIGLKKDYTDPTSRIGASQGERTQWKTDAKVLLHAKPFFWNMRCTDLILQAMKDFELKEIECSRHLLFTDLAWCWFGDKALLDIELQGQKCPVKAVTWSWFQALEDNKFYLSATAWVPVRGDRVAPVLWVCVQEGVKLSEQMENWGWGDSSGKTIDETNQLKLFVVAASTFLRQEILPVHSEPIERHARKRLEKLGVVPEEVQVVQLRKVVRSGQIARTSETECVEWNYQWTVRGHVRQQFYKTLGEHLPVWIHPYLKGPEDKPLKPRTVPIYAVLR